MAAMFELRLKSSHGGLPSGTTIHVASNLASPTDDQIREVLKRYGGRAVDAAWIGYWDCKKL
jgi:hypothetical protein